MKITLWETGNVWKVTEGSPTSYLQLDGVGNGQSLIKGGDISD
jgi:hypothetical protein